MTFFGKSCLCFIVVLTGIIVNSSEVKAQDKIVRTNKDTVLAKVIEMTSDKIRFRRYGMKTGPILEIYKNQVSKIIYENGSELEIIYDSYYVSPDLLVHPPKNVFKVDFVSPFLNHISLGYERLIKAGLNLDIKGGLIGFRISEGIDYAEGFLVKAGVKYIWTTQAISRGLKYTHPFNGKYVKPELIYSHFKTFGQKGQILYDNYALCINFGNQYIFWDVLTLDYYVGLGYGLQYSDYDATSTYDRNDIDLNYLHSHFYFGKKLPIVLNGGATIGFIF